MGYPEKINNLYCGVIQKKSYKNNGFLSGNSIQNLKVLTFNNVDDFLSQKSECLRNDLEFNNITNSSLFYKLTGRYPNFEDVFSVRKNAEFSSLEFLLTN